MKCREEIVGNAGGQFCDASGCGGRHEKQVDVLSDENMIEGAFEIRACRGIGVAFKYIDVDLVTGQGAESERRDKLRGAFRHHDDDVEAAAARVSLRCFAPIGLRVVDDFVRTELLRERLDDARPEPGFCLSEDAVWLADPVVGD